MLVLNVDDDIEDSEIFCDALKAIDPQISCIHLDNCYRAIDFLNTSKLLPDFVFIDINMPKMNGLECVQKIRENKKLKKLKIIMYSTGFNPEDLNEFTKIGVRYLVKPNKFAELVGSLKRLISSNEFIQSGEKQ